MLRCEYVRHLFNCNLAYLACYRCFEFNVYYGGSREVREYSKISLNISSSARVTQRNSEMHSLHFYDDFHTTQTPYIIFERVCHVFLVVIKHVTAWFVTGPTSIHIYDIQTIRYQSTPNGSIERYRNFEHQFSISIFFEISILYDILQASILRKIIYTRLISHWNIICKVSKSL